MNDTTAAAAFADLVSNRHSSRAFLPQPVDRDLLDSIFQLAQRAPSNCNTQPWQVAVVSGDRRAQLAQQISDAMNRGEMDMDFYYDGVYAGEFKTRQHRSASALYSAMGIAREDKAGRNAAFMRNFRFFDAPHAAFFFLPENFGIREAADLGMYAQTLMLALSANGLASCPQTALSFHAGLVRAQLGIEATQKLLFGISFGFADPQHPANRCRTERADHREVVTFYD